MAKLHFKYGSMNVGKTTILIQTIFSYESQGMKVLLIKPSIDTKGNNKVVSRVGLERKVDYLIEKDDSIIKKVIATNQKLNCLLVDEAHFLQSKQIEELFLIAKNYDIPVITYGLRTDFKGKAFTGSSRLLELADTLEEIPTICKCGKKARFNGRKVNGEFVSSGESVLIDGSDAKVEYEPLCGDCFCKYVLKGHFTE